ncbi:MAG: hypothetical protein DI535_28175 [Citrobacter freundii]|nr:MAG: hypothetical protein DI535_28175 [Citrobacter freundii]
MSLGIAFKAEMIKARRSSAFWLCLIGSAFIPLILFLQYTLNPSVNYAGMAADPWAKHFNRGWQSFSIFLLPMFVILTCSLIPQIEYKNNTWKQVFASPLSTGNIFFSKYISIILMVLFLFVGFNFFMLLSGVLSDLFHPKYTFLETGVGWLHIIKMIVKSFISLLAIIAIQYWLSLRFRNFIVPIGIGMALLVTALIVMGWKHTDKVPYAFPFLSLSGSPVAKQGFLQTHEINSIIYFIVFTLIAFADLRFRKERG